MKKHRTQIITVFCLLALIVLATILFQLNPYYIDDKQNTTDKNISQEGGDTPKSLVDTQKIIIETLGENPEIEDIYALQDILVPEVVLDIDCASIVDEKAHIYCVKQTQTYIEFFSELTWGKVIQDGLENIDSFDCNTIVAEAGKQECRDYKNNK